MASTEQNRFFIAGCQRSGTTLTRLILESHPSIACLDETRSYAALGGETVDVPDDVAHLGFKIPRWTERLGEAGGDLPNPAFYRGESVLFLLRDVRDTITSMNSLKTQGSPSWLIEWGEPILSEKIAKDEGFRERHAREIAIVRASGNAPAAVGALYWLDKTLSYFRYLERGWPVLGIRYEKLVSEPIPHLKAMLHAIGVSWDDSLLNHPGFPHDELFPDGTTVGGTDPSRSIDASSVGRWRESLSPDDERIVLEIAGDVNERVAMLSLSR